MPENERHIIPSKHDPETKRHKPSPWKPILDGFLLSPPEDWRCPCGALLQGTNSCPECGRVPREYVPTPKPGVIRDRQWREFAKQL